MVCIHPCIGKQPLIPSPTQYSSILYERHCHAYSSSSIVLSSSGYLIPSYIVFSFAFMSFLIQIWQQKTQKAN